MVYDLYLKMVAEYSTIMPDAKVENGLTLAQWSYPTEESEKPFNKFLDDFNELNEKLSLNMYKGNGFRGLIVLYFKESKTIMKIFDDLKNDISNYLIRLNHMILSKNLAELAENQNKIIEMRDKIKEKTHNLEKILIQTKLKDPKT